MIFGVEMVSGIGVEFYGEDGFMKRTMVFFFLVEGMYIVRLGGD